MRTKSIQRISPCAVLVPGLLAVAYAECELATSTGGWSGSGYSVTYTQDTYNRQVESRYFNVSGNYIYFAYTQDDDCVSGIQTYDILSSPTWTTSMYRYIDRSANNYNYANATVVGEGGYAVGSWQSS